MTRAPDDELRAALRADPHADPARLAKALGLSSRARRRIVRELELEGVLRARWRGRLLAGLLVVGAVSGGLWWALGGRGERAEVPEAGPERRPLSPEAAAAERDLYRAIDRRDPAKLDEARAQLASPEPPLRLAALRYLVSVGGSEQAPSTLSAMLALTDDPSERVRGAAVQLVASLPGALPPVDERLANVLADAGRPIAERRVAAEGLEAREVERPHEVAQGVLPALRDDSLPLREATVRVLVRLMGRSVPVSVEDPSALHAAWSAVVGARE